MTCTTIVVAYTVLCNKTKSYVERVNSCRTLVSLASEAGWILPLPRYVHPCMLGSWRSIVNLFWNFKLFLLQPLYRKIYRKAALVANFSDDSPVCSFSGRLVAKPVRVRVPSSPLVDTESGGSKVIAEAGVSKNHSEDFTLVSAGFGAAPTLEWTSAIQVNCWIVRRGSLF